MAYDTVLFDLDGTLLNTLEDLARSSNHVCELHGWPTFPIDAYRYKVGNGMAKLVERIVPAEFAGDQAVFDRAYAEFIETYAAHKEDHTAPYPGIAELLDELAAAGVAAGVLTNKGHASAVPLVDHYFGRDRFALVQGKIDAFPPKPAAPVTLHALELMGADAASTVFVGDSNVDVETGHNAGLPVIGVTWGFRGREELEAAGADAIVDTPGELARAILG